MSNNSHIQSFLESKTAALTLVEELLSLWDYSNGCYKVPELLEAVRTQLHWSEKQARSNDPIIREYIRSNPEYFITQGAHGGIMKSSERQKKEELLLAKKKAKEELNAVLDAQVAAKIANIID